MFISRLYNSVILCYNTRNTYTPNGIAKEFSKLSEKFRIACSFHGLRHYYASIMDALGIPENYQMAGQNINYIFVQTA